TEDAAPRLEARREVDDPEPVAVLVGLHRLQHRRVAHVTLLAGREPLDPDRPVAVVGVETVEQAAEDGRAVHARRTHPHDRALPVDKSRRRGVADDTEIEGGWRNVWVHALKGGRKRDFGTSFPDNTREAARVP